jgi:hypothetical protein
MLRTTAGVTIGGRTALYVMSETTQSDIHLRGST